MCLASNAGVFAKTLSGEEVVIEAKHVKCRIGSVPAFEKVTVGGRWHESHLRGI